MQNFQKTAPPAQNQPLNIQGFLGGQSSKFFVQDLWTFWISVKQTGGLVDDVCLQMIWRLHSVLEWEEVSFFWKAQVKHSVKYAVNEIDTYTVFVFELLQPTKLLCGAFQLSVSRSKTGTTLHSVGACLTLSMRPEQGRKVWWVSKEQSITLSPRCSPSSLSPAAHCCMSEDSSRNVSFVEGEWWGSTIARLSPRLSARRAHL